MATIPLTPIMMGNAKLTLGLDDYEGHVSSAVFTPGDNAPVVFKSLTPDGSHSFPKKATWTLDLGYAQDWETASALSDYLHEHEGETVHAVLEPVSGATGYEADIIVTPGPIGGDVDTVAVGTVSMGVQGRPEKVVAP